MNSKLQFLSLLFYILFAYQFWILKSVEFAAISSVVFFFVSFFVSQLQSGLKLLGLILGTHLVLGVFYRVYPALAWPFDFYLVSIIGFIVLKLLYKQPLFSKLGWSFRFNRLQLLSILIINIPAILCLGIYFYFNQEVAKAWPLPDLPVWAIPLVVLAIAMINGLREEIYFRGLIQTNSIQTFSSSFTVILQGVLFGSIHFWNSYPQGWIGVFMTGIWGMAIALQYQIFRSISLAWITHAIADAVMFTVILLNR